MKKYLLFTFLQLAIFANGQDTTWRKITIDENVEVTLPEINTKFDTVIREKGMSVRTKLYHSNNGDRVLNFMVSEYNEYLKLNEESITGFKAGISRSMRKQELKCFFIDTVVNGQYCIKAICFFDKISDPVLYQYGFPSGNKMYNIVYYMQKDVDIKKQESDLRRILSGISFKNPLLPLPLNAFDENSSAFKKGEVIGEVFGTLIVIAGLIWVFIYFIRKTNKK